jgi:predicted RNase H-like HicB family nuclease
VQNPTVSPTKGQLVSSPSFCQIPAMEVVFSITQEADGGFVGECLSHDIFTQGDTWDALRANVKEAVDAYFFDQPRPASIRLHLVRDEVLAVA